MRYKLTLIVCVVFGIHTILSSQRFEYKELTPIPEFEISDVYYSPMGEVYVVSYSHLYISIDKGVQWEEIKLPDGFLIETLEFLSDGTPIISDGLFHRGALILRDNEWVSFLPELMDDFSPYLLAVDQMMIYYVDDQVMYQSFDKGLTFISFTNPLIVRKPLALKADGNRFLILLKQVTAGNVTESVMLCDEYFNSISTSSVNFRDGEELFENVYFKNGHLLLVDPENKNVFYSPNYGSDFLTKRIDINGLDWGIYQDRFYYLNGNNVRRVKLTGDFDQNLATTFISLDSSAYMKISNDYLIGFDFNKVHFNALEGQQDFSFEDLPFKSCNVEKIEIGVDGSIYVSTKRNLYLSSDEGVTWDHLYFDENNYGIRFSLSKYDSSVVLAVDENETRKFYSNGQVATFSHEIENSNNKIYSFSARYNDDDYLIVISSSPCNGSLLEVILYKNEEIFTNSIVLGLGCFNGDVHMRRIGDNLVFYGLDDTLILFVLDIINSAFDFKSFQLNLSENIKYVATVSENDELTVFANKLNGTHTNYFTSFYSDNVFEELRPAGRGPVGFLVEYPLYKGQFLVNDDGGHYYRSNVNNNFVPLDLSGRKYRFIKDAVFDRNGNLYLLAEYGKVIRSNTVEIISSNYEISKESISIYPNPVFDIINIDVENDSYVDTYILNLNGEVVNESRNFGSNFTIDVSNIQSGMYFLYNKSENQSWPVRSFVKF